MPTRILPFAFLSLLVAHPALAQQASGYATPPQVGPRSTGAPSSEAGIGVAQIVVGTLATAAAGVGLAILAGETNSAPLALVAVATAPGVGAWIVCRIGRNSTEYEGNCAPTIVVGYFGAILLAIPMAYVGAAAFSPSSSDGGWDSGVGAALGVAVGIVVGTAVGATIGWQVSKHRRGAALPISFGPPPAPPAALADWADLRPRSAETRAPLAVYAPLLSLRF